MRSHGTVLVTGASAGIGRALALVFASHGHDLVLVARRGDLLDALADEVQERTGRRARVLARDLLTPGAPQAIAAELEADGIEVEVLVNDAGVLELGAFDRTELSALERMVELNVRVLVSMTRLFLPGMRARGRGRVLNVASSASFQPVPSLAVYAATKAFVLSLSEALSEELAGTGVTVTAVCPGLTTTHMTDRAKSQSHNASRFPDFLMADAGDVARAAHAACLAGRAIAVPGLTNRVLTHGSRLLPRWFNRKLGGLVGRRFLDR